MQTCMHTYMQTRTYIRTKNTHTCLDMYERAHIYTHIQVHAVRKFQTNEQGTPCLAFMYKYIERARNVTCRGEGEGSHKLQFDAYVNGDIVFTASIVDTLLGLRKCVYTCTYLYLNIYIYVYRFIYVHAYMHICIYLNLYPCLYLHLYLYMYMYIYMYIYRCMYVYVNIHIYIYIYIYICIYIYIYI